MALNKEQLKILGAQPAKKTALNQAQLDILSGSSATAREDDAEPLSDDAMKALKQARGEDFLDERKFEQSSGVSMETTPGGTPIAHTGYGPGNPMAQARIEARERLGPKHAATEAKAAALPEYPDTFSLSSALLTSSDEERALILEEQGIPVEREGGRVFVKGKDGTQYVLNKPNFSAADAKALAGDVLSFAPAGAIASAFKTPAKRALVGAATGAFTETIRQAQQDKIGGTFDGLDIVISALGEGPAAEFAVPIFKALYKKIDPTYADQLVGAKGLQDLQEMGFTIDEINEIAREAGDGALIKSSPAAQAQMKAIGSRDVNKARAIQKYVDKEASNARKRTLSALSDSSGVPIEKAVFNASKSLKDSMANDFKMDRLYSSSLYKKAFDGADPIDAREIIDFARNGPLAETLRKSLPEANIKNIIEGLVPREYAEVVELAADTLQKQIDVLKGFGGEELADEISNLQKRILNYEDVSNVKLSKAAEVAGIKVPDIPPMKTTAEKLQKSLWDVQDKISGPGGKRQNVDRAMNPLRKFITGKLSTSTKGAFNKAQLNHSKMLEKFDRIETTLPAMVAKSGDINLDTVLNKVMKPSPNSSGLSRSFLKDLKNVDPIAAKDLVVSYFDRALRSFRPDAKPSEILSEFFGDSASSRKHVLDMLSMGASPKLAQKVTQMEKVLKSAKAVEDISTDNALIGWINKKLDPDAAHWVYLRLAFSRAFKDVSDKKLMDEWFSVATEPRFSKQWREMMKQRDVLRGFKDTDAKIRAKEAEKIIDNLTDVWSSVKGGVAVSEAKAYREKSEFDKKMMDADSKNIF